MGVIPSKNTSGANKVNELWATLQIIVRALDPLVAQRSERTVPAVALRRSDSNIGRCRQLMLEGSVDYSASAWPTT
jgi:hypothetical protein